MNPVLAAGRGNWQRWGLIGGLVVLLVVVNGLIAAKESTIAHGERVLLKLAPRDPRSLMQGDYMALNYEINRQVEAALAAKYAGSARDVDRGVDGFLVVRLDADGVATWLRLDDGQPLARDERRLLYRKRHGRVRVGTDAFFFEEGQGDAFNAAQYGEFRRERKGSLVLIGMLDAKKQPVRPVPETEGTQ